MRGEDYLYVERQSLHPILLIGALVAGSAGVTALVVSLDLSSPARPEGGAAGIVALAVAAFLLNFLPMSTWVDREEIRVRFGRLVPFYTKRVPISRVKAARAVDYRPILQAGGWGIRWGRFEGKWTRFLNARGHWGVLLEGEKLRLIVGSAHPEEFAEAVAKAREVPDRRRSGVRRARHA
jgi:hypothetical protein